MTPTAQEFVHAPERGQQGDCMRAVIASLLDLPLARVPHFAQLDADGEGNFWIMLAEFCRSHGYSFVIMHGRFGWSEDVIYHGIGGPSPRDGYHAVVGRNGQIVHDPHPSQAGLGGEPSEWQHYLLVRMAEAANENRPTAKGAGGQP